MFRGMMAVTGVESRRWEERMIGVWRCCKAGRRIASSAGERASKRVDETAGAFVEVWGSLKSSGELGERQNKEEI